MKRSRRAQHRGFTLLELLLTLGVTTIALVGLMSLHLSIARGNDGASRFSEATQIANTTVESLRAQRIADMLVTLAAVAPPIDFTMPTVTGRAGMTYSRRVIVTALTGATTNLWRIRVEVGWAEEGAAIGSAGDPLTHFVASEVIRTVEEAL